MEIKLFKQIIPESILIIADLFKSAGKELYVVGGAVRDYVMGEEPKDFDVCTNAEPNDVLTILKGYRAELNGESFGVVRVYTDDQPLGIEIATFRIDIYGEEQLGETRNPKVEFATIKEDVNRRDLTINALFYEIGKERIVDLVGGRDDLNSGIIRMVGEPTLRITEDPLRMLRAIRFKNRYDFEIDGVTAGAITRNKDRIRIISRERIYEELVDKSFKQSSSYTDYLTDMRDTLLLEGIFEAKFTNQIRDRQFITSYLTEMFMGTTVNLRELVPKFKFTLNVAQKITFLTQLATFDDKSSGIDFFKQKKKCHITDDEILDFIDTPLIRAFLAFGPSVSSEELMEQGFSGPELGREIKRLEDINFQILKDELKGISI